MFVGAAAGTSLALNHIARSNPRPMQSPSSLPALMSFMGCPLCGQTSLNALRSDRCDQHPLWQPGLPQQLDWVHCPQCDHIFTKTYFTPEGLKILLSRAHSHQVTGQNLDHERAQWSPTVERVVRHLAAPPWSAPNTLWLDVGCGSGGLVMTASEYGFTAIGVDARPQAVQAITDLSYRAVLGDLNSLEVSEPVDVISLADVLEHVAFPRQALQRVHTALKSGGLLVVSCPNLDSASWRQSNISGTNPYWSELEHCHNFSRASLMHLLMEEGFQPLEYNISPRYKSCMEVIARKVNSGS